MNLIDLLDKSLPLIGVAIGAGLSPWFAYKFESLKRKRQVKQELVRLIYLFYNYQKSAYRNTTVHDFKFFRRELTVSKIRPFLQDKTEIDMDIERDESDTRDISDKLDEGVQLLLDVEAQIISLLYEVQVLFDIDTYKSISFLIEPIINKYNKPGVYDLIDFSQITKENLEDVRKSIKGKIETQVDLLHAECTSLIKEIHSVLPR